MTLRPVLAGRIAPTMPEQGGKQLLASPHQMDGGVDSCADQIAHASWAGSGTHTGVRSEQAAEVGRAGRAAAEERAGDVLFNHKISSMAGAGTGHVDRAVKAQTLPEALPYLWENIAHGA